MKGEDEYIEWKFNEDMIDKNGESQSMLKSIQKLKRVLRPSLKIKRSLMITLFIASRARCGRPKNA